MSNLQTTIDEQNFEILKRTTIRDCAFCLINLAKGVGQNIRFEAFGAWLGVGGGRTFKECLVASINANNTILYSDVIFNEDIYKAYEMAVSSLIKKMQELVELGADKTRRNHVDSLILRPKNYTIHDRV